jgi:hypothetical protein
VFAEWIGWEPQYLANLLRGLNFGLKPVITLLSALPEINARWLILGQGSMLMDDCSSNMHTATSKHIQSVLDLERYVPVMDEEELQQYQQMIAGHKAPLFDLETRAKWAERMMERKNEELGRILEAQQKSDELCSQKTVRK